MAERIEVFTENYEEMYGHKPKGQGTWISKYLGYVL